MYQAIILDYNYIDNFLTKQNLDIHYNIYLSNLNKLNNLLKSINFISRYSLDYLIKNIDIFPLNIRGELLYYLSSVINHNIYFNSISNKGNNKPVGLLEKDINKYFGNFDNFIREFKDKAIELKGSGYTFLVIDKDNSLKIINTSNEDNPYYYGMVPIFSIDLWEHAYFLDYYNEREEYIDNFLKGIDFIKINSYYRELLRK